MAITLDTTSAAANTVTSVGSVTFSHTVGSGATILAIECTAIRGSGDITGVTWNGNACTRAGTTGYIASQTSQLWYIINPSSGTANIVVTYTDSSTFEPKNGAISLFGTDTSSPIGVTAQNNGGSGSISTNITTGTANSWIIDTLGTGNTDIGTAGGSQTEIWKNNNGAGSQDGAASYRTTTTAGSYTLTWTGGQVWQDLLVEIKPGTASTATPNFFQLM